MDAIIGRHITAKQQANDQPQVKQPLHKSSPVFVWNFVKIGLVIRGRVIYWSSHQFTSDLGTRRRADREDNDASVFKFPALKSKLNGPDGKFDAQHDVQSIEKGTRTS